MNKAVITTIIILLAVIGNSIAQTERKGPRLPGTVIIAEP